MRQAASRWLKDSAPAPVRSAAGRALRLRRRGRSGHALWEAELSHEAGYWRRFFDEHPGQTAWRADPRSEVPPHAPLHGVLAALEQDRVRILDVGAGPMTALGYTFPGKQLDITAVDPLAADYDAALADAGIEPPVRTVFAEGERLTEHFTPGSFDVSTCQNALDHCYDPLVVIEQMVAVTRPGGTVILQHRRNEAEHQLYHGLHQWNLDAEGDRLVIWNPTTRHDVHEHFAGRADCRAEVHDGDVWAFLRPV